MAIKIGDKLKNFSAKNQDGKTVKLSDFKGKNLVLYFYPKDNTPGCTQEAKDFRDNLEKFDKLNAVILGVSKDDENKHQIFIEKYDLPFDLLADTEGELCQEFGVWVQKSMFGKKYMGIERSTFLIDSKGKVAAEWRKVKVKGHAEQVLAALVNM